MRSWVWSSLALALGLALGLAACAGQGSDQAQQESADQDQADTATPAGGQEEAGEAGASAVARPSTAGALRVEGTKLVASDGSPVQLRGVSTHGLAWFPQYVNQDLFSQLANDWDANVVRLALYSAESGGYTTGGDQAAQRKLVEDGVAYATAADMYAIVDWHVLGDANPQVHKEEAKAFFDTVSADLAGYDNVIYEICNEPNGSTTWADVRAYAEEVIPVIRAHDPDAVIVVGTPEWSQRVDQAAADPLDEGNVMYALHFYAATHKDDLRQRMRDAVAAGLPVFVTEFGICDASGNGAIDEASADEWVSAMDELGVSWCMWSLCNKDESASVIAAGCDKVSGLDGEDLAPAGAWLKATLLSEAAGEGVAPAGSAVAGGASGAGAASTAPASGTTGEAGSNLSGSSGSLTWQARVTNSWPEGGRTCYQYDLTLTNGGDAVTSWSLEVPLAEGFALKDGWNGTYQADGATLRISNASYNGEVAAGGTVADIGFQVIL